MTDEIEASCQPAASRDKKLGPTLVSKWIEIEDCILKGFGVESDTISHGSKFSDGDTMRPKHPWIDLFALWAAFDSPRSITKKCKYQKHIHQLKKGHLEID